MLRQYRPQRFRYTAVGNRLRPIGIIPIGTIIWLPGGKAIVEAWLPREIFAWRFDNTQWQPTFVANGMWLAHCRMLHNNRRIVATNRTLLDAYNYGRSLAPDEPDVRHRTGRMSAVARAA